MTPREVWPHEALDFTPWLLANADVLGEILGMELELEVAEHPVGDFSLDLLGRDVATGERVIVENQLDVSDHRHLGQILTYAAGTDPTTIIWVAPRFRPEHRAALDWLNTRTDTNTRFFAVEIVVVRIGESLPAPAFRLVAQPNDWEKTVRASSRSTGSDGQAGTQYAAVWSQFLELIQREQPGWSRTSRVPRGPWFGMSTGERGATYYAGYTKRGLSSELYFEDSDADVNRLRWQALHDKRDAMEAAYGGPLEFLDMPTRKGTRIADYLSGADAADEQERESHVRWLLQKQLQLRRAVAAVGGIPKTNRPHRASMHDEPPAI